jgi:hypothetical protein
VGQSRDDGIDARIKDAAMRTVVEDGLAGLNVRAICVRARASEAEFYERWPDDWAALLAALDERTRLPVLPDTGCLLDDLVAHVQGYRRHLDDPTYSAIVFYLLGEARTDPCLRAKIAPGSKERRRRNLVLIERAVARGELPAGVDGDAILNAVLGLGISWLSTRQVLDDHEVRRAVEQAIASVLGAASPRGRIPKATPAHAYSLYLFGAAPDAGGGRVAEARAIERASEGEAIAEADAQRRGRYAELWKEGRVLRIFEPD